MPPLGPFRTFQVPIVDLARLTGLDLGPLSTADQLAGVPAVAAVDSAPSTAGAPVSPRWRRLQTEGDVRSGLPA